MIQKITANELKTKGISAASDENEVVITVRGIDKFVILPIKKYNYLRECEFEAALIEVKKDLKEGKFKKESVEKHIKRIANG